MQRFWFLATVLFHIVYIKEQFVCFVLVTC